MSLPESQTELLPTEENTMNAPTTTIVRQRVMNMQAGKIGWALLWMLGIPLPVLLVLYLIRGH